MPKEICERISKSMLGNKNNVGRIFSDATKKKISDAQKGRHFSEEHKRKISEAKKGSTHKTISDKAKQKISDAYPYKRKILCIETGSIYNSIHECARKLNLLPTNICKVCKGKFKTTGGYHLKYYDN